MTVHDSLQIAFNSIDSLRVLTNNLNESHQVLAAKIDSVSNMTSNMLIDQLETSQQLDSIGAQLKTISEHGIGFSDSAETCPTSNYLIGYFDKYIDLPLFTFMEQLPDNAISINTDDKGIIATSIENEYALIAAAMEKSRKYKGKIGGVITRVVKDARKSRFKVQ